MPALAKDRPTPTRAGVAFDYPVAAATKIFGGALVCLNAAGDAVPGSVSTTLTAVGRCDKLADNSTGAAAAISVKVRPGNFRWANSAAGDLITKAAVGKQVFIVDDQTVALTNGGGTRSVAGIVTFVEPLGVWVMTGIANA